VRAIAIALVVGLAAVELMMPDPQISAADRDAITATALDYIEGFYSGDAARMERSLSPDLVKRIVRVDASTGQSRIDGMDAQRLIAITRSRAGGPPPARQQKDVTVLDVVGNAATVKVVANDWIDYLHIARVNGRWVIVNVLWEMKQAEK
jgi:hypothetical protein